MQRYYQQISTGLWFHLVRSTSGTFPETLEEDAALYASSLGIPRGDVRVVEADVDPRGTMKPKPPDGVPGGPPERSIADLANSADEMTDRERDRLARAAAKAAGL